MAAVMFSGGYPPQRPEHVSWNFSYMGAVYALRKSPETGKINPAILNSVFTCGVLAARVLLAFELARLKKAMPAPAINEAVAKGRFEYSGSCTSGVVLHKLKAFTSSPTRT